MLPKVAKNLPSAIIKTFIKTIGQLLISNKINENEAIKILGLKDNFKKDEIDTSYKNLHFLNSKEKGGSKYIQEKIENAYKY